MLRDMMEYLSLGIYDGYTMPNIIYDNIMTWWCVWHMWRSMNIYPAVNEHDKPGRGRWVKPPKNPLFWVELLIYQKATISDEVINYDYDDGMNWAICTQPIL